MKRLKNYQVVAEEAALAAGSFLMKNLGKIRSIRYKGRMNLTTDIDTKSERMIVKMVRRAFPDHSLLCEETGSIKKNSSPFRWLIDPIDGTTNFAHGFPFFSVSIALLYHDEPIVGVVYDPTRDELFSATKGKGSRLNRKPMVASKVRDLKRALLVTGFPYRLGKDMKRNIDYFKRFMLSSQAVRRVGSAALDLCYVACGRFDAFWEKDLHPWDTAAGAIIVKEASGKITTFEGLEFTPFKKEVIASNSLIHSQMLKVLNGSSLCAQS